MSIRGRLLYTGMRAGEIKGLTRRQVNLDNRTVHLTETKNGSARTFPLTLEAAAVLRLALANPVRPIDTNLIFFGEPGRDKVRRPYEFRPAWHRTPTPLRHRRPGGGGGHAPVLSGPPAARVLALAARRLEGAGERPEEARQPGSGWHLCAAARAAQCRLRAL